MKAYRDFENDPVNFNYRRGAEFLAKLHDRGQHFVPIVDAAIYHPNPENASDIYATYDRGTATNSFMLNPDGSQYIGQVWPGYTVFPDFVGSGLNGTGAEDWWKQEIINWHDKIPFDGLWIDSMQFLQVLVPDSYLPCLVLAFDSR